MCGWRISPILIVIFLWTPTPFLRYFKSHYPAILGYYQSSSASLPAPGQVSEFYIAEICSAKWEKLEIGVLTCSSARTHYSNDITTTTPMFPSSGNTDRYFQFTGHYHELYVSRGVFERKVLYGLQAGVSVLPLSSPHLQFSTSGMVVGLQ